MPVSYFVRYQGLPEDPAAFLDYYATRHADTLRAFPKIRSLVLHTPVAWNDPFPVTPDATALLAQMSFDSPEDLNRALTSDARARARDDFANFPKFDGTATHQALSARTIF